MPDVLHNEIQRLAFHNQRLEAQVVRLTKRLADAGLLGAPVDALNGDEQRAGLRVSPTDEQRRSRANLYQAREAMIKVVNAMPVSEDVKSELRVLHGAAFRMSILHNDGDLAPITLQIW